MVRWGMAAGWLFLLACGMNTSGEQGVARTSGGAPVVDGGADGGTASCTSTSKLLANAGTGNLCGLKPVLGSPRLIRIDSTGLPPTRPGFGCAQTYPSDRQGNLLASWIIAPLTLPPVLSLVSYAASGTRLGAAQDNGPAAFPLESGWIFAVRAGSPGYDLELRTASLALPTGTFLHQPLAYARGPQGGIALLSPIGRPLDGLPPYYTPPPDAGPACEPSPGTDVANTVFLTRYDSSGVQGPAAPLGLGCVSNTAQGSVAENARGDVLAIFQGRLWHLAPDSTLSSFPFDRTGTLAPLADGRFALGAGANWTATISIDGTVSPPPCWLAARNDVYLYDIVLGGKGYLLYHQAFVTPNPVTCDRYAEFVLADGTSCGFIGITGTADCNPQTVAVGLDGTLSTLDQASCTISFWPGAFR